MSVSKETVSLHRLRFTLRTLLIGTACVAVAVMLVLAYRQGRENQLLRQENLRLRNELGEIQVEPGDKDKLHAVAVPTAESMTWKWRIFVPAGRIFSLYSAGDEIPAAGESRASFSKLQLVSGQQTIVVTLHKDYRGQLCWHAQTPHSSSTFSTGSPEFTKLIEDDNFGSTSASVSSLTKVEPHHDLQLLRIRLFPTPPGGSVNSSQLSTAGPGAEITISEH